MCTTHSDHNERQAHAHAGTRNAALTTNSKTDTHDGCCGCLHTQHCHHTPRSLKCWSKHDHRSNRCATNAKQKQAKGSRTTPLGNNTLHSLATPNCKLLSYTRIDPHSWKQITANPIRAAAAPYSSQRCAAAICPNLGTLFRPQPRPDSAGSPASEKEASSVAPNQHTPNSRPDVYMYLSSPRSLQPPSHRNTARTKPQNRMRHEDVDTSGSPSKQPSHNTTTPLQAPQATHHQLCKHNTRAPAVVCSATATAHIVRQTAHRQSH